MDPDILKERVYTLRDVATMIGMTRRYVLKQIHEGRLRAERYGTAWRVRESDVACFVANHTTSARVEMTEFEGRQADNERQR